MTIYTVHFNTEADWTSYPIEADTAEQALEQARRFADTAIWELNFQPYDQTSDIEHIEVMDPDGHAVAEWHDPALLLRLAAGDLLDAVQQAVAALNTVPRFPVPSLLTCSYQIAARCEAAIAKAKGGVS